MLRGYRTEIKLSRRQKKKIDLWIAAQNGIYNAKCGEEDYFYRFHKASLSLTGQRPPTDSAYSHLVSYWMRAVPSQILRNGAARFFEARQRFLKGLAQHPRKKKGSRRSCRITRELFSCELYQKEKIRKACICLKRIGKIRFEIKEGVLAPKMLSLSRTGGRYFLSFCYDDGKKVEKQSELYEKLKEQEVSNLNFLGIDRGVTVQSACSNGSVYQFSPEEKKRLQKKESRKKRFQRKVARQQKGSKNYKKTREKLSKVSAQLASIKSNFNHHVSKSIVQSGAHVVTLEDLKLTNMTRSAQGTKEEPGSRVAAKSGLNRAILNCNLGQQFEFIRYKAIQSNILVLKTRPHNSSIECRKCTHSDSGNRRTQAEFKCLRCGHAENADINAAHVVAQRGRCDFLSGKVVFLDESKKKVRARRTRVERACEEDVRQDKRSLGLAASMKQEPESKISPAKAG